MSASRVMVVDDEEFVVEELAEALTEEGYAVTSVTSAAAALRHSALREIDVIVTDLKMPGKNGIDLFVAMTARGIDAVGVLLTGHGAQAERDAAEDAGFFAFLSKPVDIDHLLDTVAAACAAKCGSRP